MPTFKTTLRGVQDMNATGIEIPAEVVESLGAGKRPKVVVTVNGSAYRSTVAVMGAILNLGLQMAGARVTSEEVRALMDRTSGAPAPAVDQGLKTALASSLHWVFVAMFVLCAATLVAAWMMPQPNVEEPFRRRAPQPAE